MAAIALSVGMPPVAHAAGDPVAGDVLVSQSNGLTGLTNIGGASYGFTSLRFASDDISSVYALSSNGELYRASYSSSPAYWQRVDCADGRTFSVLLDATYGNSILAMDTAGTYVDVASTKCAASSLQGAAVIDGADDYGVGVNGEFLVISGSGWNPAGNAFDGHRLTRIARFSHSAGMVIGLDDQGQAWKTDTDSLDAPATQITAPEKIVSLFSTTSTGINAWALGESGKSLGYNIVRNQYSYVNVAWPQTKYLTTRDQRVALIAGNPAAAAMHTLTFDLNGPTDIKPPAKQTLDASAPTSKPVDPIWPGHTFLGWFTASDTTGTEFQFGQPLTADVTVFAHWNDGSGTTIACAPQTGMDPAVSAWQSLTVMAGLLAAGLSVIVLRLQVRLRRRL